MAANTFDAEIRKYLPLLGNEEKRSLLTVIKNLLHIAEPDNTSTPENNKIYQIDYTKYHFPVSAIKFNRDEINER